MTRAFLGLGTNLGDRESELRRACEQIAMRGDLVAISSLYETEPMGGPPQGLFLNMVVELDTQDSPEKLLERCRELESIAQRVRGVKNGPRTLDADVLWMEGISRNSEVLTVPHPRMWERRFVLEPLCELAPDLVSEEHRVAALGDVRIIGRLSL